MEWRSQETQWQFEGERSVQLREQLKVETEYWNRRWDARMARIEAMFEQLMKGREKERMQDQPSSVYAHGGIALEAQPVVFSKLKEEADQREAVFERMKDLPPFSSQARDELSDPQSCDSFGAETVFKEQSSTNEVPVVDSFASKDSTMSDIKVGSGIHCDVIDESESKEGYTSQIEKFLENQNGMARLNTNQLMLTDAMRSLEISEGDVMVNWQQDECSKFVQSDQNDAQSLCHRFSPKWYHRHKYKNKTIYFLKGSEELPNVKENEVDEEYEKSWAELIEMGAISSLLAANNTKEVQLMKFQGQNSPMLIDLKKMCIEFKKGKVVKWKMKKVVVVKLCQDNTEKEEEKEGSQGTVAHFFDVGEFSRKVVSLNLHEVPIQYLELLVVSPQRKTIAAFSKSFDIKPQEFDPVQEVMEICSNKEIALSEHLMSTIKWLRNEQLCAIKAAGVLKMKMLECLSHIMSQAGVAPGSNDLVSKFFVELLGENTTQEAPVKLLVRKMVKCNQETVAETHMKWVNKIEKSSPREQYVKTTRKCSQIILEDKDFSREGECHVWNILYWELIVDATSVEVDTVSVEVDKKNR